MTGAFHDIGRALARTPLWTRLAVTDLQQTYKRSMIGLIWIAFSFGLFVAVKTIIFGSFAPGDPRQFAMWVTFGLWIFFFIQLAVIDGCNVFANSRSWLLGTDLPLTGFIIQSLVRGLIKFGFQGTVVLFMVIYVKWDFKLVSLWAIPGFFLLVFNIVWIQIFLGIVCARFRDIAHLILSIMQVAFFITPILYYPTMLGPKAGIMKWNPFTHYLAIMRDPIVMHELNVNAWIIVGCFTVIGWASALFALQVYRKRVPFWV